MSGIKDLQEFYRCFSPDRDSKEVLSRLENRLKKRLGFSQAFFVLRDPTGLKRLDGRIPWSLAEQRKIKRRFSRQFEPYLSKRRGWRGIWPVVIGKDWVGCLSVERPSSRSDFNDEEKTLLELVAHRAALDLAEKNLWESLDRAGWRHFFGLGSAAIAHEIRSPLAALGVFVQLLPEKKNDEVFLKKFHDVGVREIDRLSRLTAAYLDRASDQEKAVNDLDLGRIVEESTGLVGPLFKNAGVRLTVSGRRVLLRRGRKDQLKSLVLNLLQNALEMSRRGGSVRVTTALVRGARGPWVRFTVRDDGKGIRREDRERIFAPYFSTRQNGAGLGLAICRRMVENHGGQIRVVNSRRGALFQVRLPAG